MTKPNSLLCVCLGNICRSPTAEAMFRHQLALANITMTVDSAGTSAHHVGEPPDSRSQAHAKQRGLDLSRIRSRQVVAEDFVNFDLLLAMDTANLNKLQRMQQDAKNTLIARGLNPVVAEVALLSKHDPKYLNKPLPDPYYGGDAGFEQVLDQCQSSIDAWIAHWQNS